jgi:RNase adaptor protein for sRNA GlmZ degradation
MASERIDGDPEAMDVLASEILSSASDARALILRAAAHLEGMSIEATWDDANQRQCLARYEEIRARAHPLFEELMILARDIRAFATRYREASGR